MGSVGVLLKHKGKALFYTGDVNFEPQTIAREADFPTEGIDALITESTRGDYQRPEGFTRRAEKERLAKVIRETFAANGAVLLPVFALGKSQELLLMLDELLQMDLIPEAPVIIGGLSTKMTVLYDHYSSRTRRSYEGFRILEDMEALVAPRRRRKEIQYNPHTIYALSSGMMSEGTTSNQFARRFIDNPQNSVAFVGYTDKETPGFRLRNAKPGEMIQLDAKLPPVELRCRVESFDFSAHATREQLMAYIRQVHAPKVLLVHGEPSAQDWFKRTMNGEIPQVEVLTPEPGVKIDLW
jgi:predicted metal-dependent RNase